MSPRKPRHWKHSPAGATLLLQLGASDAKPDRARLAVETHLARIAQHRPVEEIADPEEQAHAERLRAWFTAEFLAALLD